MDAHRSAHPPLLSATFEQVRAVILAPDGLHQLREGHPLSGHRIILDEQELWSIIGKWTSGGVIVAAMRGVGKALNVQRSIRSKDHLSSIAVISIVDEYEETSVVAGLKGGLDECLNWAISSAELKARIEAAVRRRAKMAQEVQSFAGITYNPLQFRAWRGGRELNLSVNRLRLLSFLMKHPGMSFSREELLDRVWNNPALELCTVTGAVLQIRRELTRKGEPDLIQTIRGRGYSLQAPE